MNKNIIIRFDQHKWLRKTDINFSKFVRDALDAEIERRAQFVGASSI